MSKKLGFIGCGNMGKAMIHGVLASGKCGVNDILASAKTESSREKNAAELGIRLTADNKSVAEFADILFLAVKPQYYEEVIAEIKDTVSDDEIIVSIAPGKSLSWFDEMFGKSLKVIRTMPNTPAMVGEGMMGVCANALCRVLSFRFSPQGQCGKCWQSTNYAKEASMVQSVTYQSETKTVHFQGKSIVLESLTPVLSPKEKEKRKKEIERCLYEVFSKYRRASDTPA